MNKKPIKNPKTRARLEKLFDLIKKNQGCTQKHIAKLLIKKPSEMDSALLRITKDTAILVEENQLFIQMLGRSKRLFTMDYAISEDLPAKLPHPKRKTLPNQSDLAHMQIVQQVRLVNSLWRPRV